MDGYPTPKSYKWRGQIVSETRYYVYTWMEKELPKLSGRIINIGAGGSPVPRQLLDFSKVKKYTTFDKKIYGGSKNPVDIYGDVQNMPQDWAGKWNAALCIEVIECVENPFKAFDEMYRILKPGGVLLLTCPFNYRHFGDGAWYDPKQNKKGVKDYWRPTKQGLELLSKKFSKSRVEGFGGSGPHDRFVHCLRAVK